MQAGGKGFGVNYRGKNFLKKRTGYNNTIRTSNG
jgi:hypothetical protein